MANLSGKTALVTGANSGIGLEACVMLARDGAHVAMVARSPAKGQAALDEVKRRSGSSALSLFLCDFGSQAQIRRLADEVKARHPRLDILVNNAGSVSPERKLTEDGLEQTFAVNHLGYFLLTNLLIDVLRMSAPARIVNVSSIAHRRGDIDFDNLQYEKGGYFVMSAYARSKLSNVLFTSELARRLAGTGVTATSLHPGAVQTEIWSHAPWYAKPLLAVAKLFMITSEEGGGRIHYLAGGDEVAGETGAYYEKNKKVWPSRTAQDEALAKRLWDVSEKLVKLS